MKKKLLIILSILLCMNVVAGVFYFSILNKSESFYIASNTNILEVLNKEGEVQTLRRGMLVEAYNEKTIDGQKMRHIKIEDEDYYVPIEYLVSNKEDCLLEETIYTILPSVLYEDGERSIIASYINKGEALKVEGFNKMNEDGSVERYAVSYGDDFGYILASNVALDVVEDEILEIHYKREDAFGGGNAYTLEYPKRDPFIAKEGVMPEVVKAIYINGESVVDMQMYLDIAKETNINAFVVDIRDSHLPSYASLVAQEYSPTTYSNAILSFEDYQSYLNLAKEEGIYLIGRITVFKDTNYALDHPEDAILDNTSHEAFYYASSYWPSAFDRDVWQYNIEVAKEAVTEMGFDEIQFDYTRFPDRVDHLEAKALIDLRNEYQESKAQAIQRFLLYAKDELHALDTYVSVDVFGEAANPYVTAYGQYWPALTSVVDVISAMPYPDHFAAHDYNIEEYVWEVPYKLLTYWSKTAMKRQNEAYSPAIARTWIQGYDAMRDPYVVYDSDKILEQIKALDEQGLTGGYIVWNAASSVYKYQTYKDAFLY